MRKIIGLYDYLVLYLGLLWLGLLCLGWTLVAVVLYPLLPLHRGRALGRWVIMVLFRCYLASLSASRRLRRMASALSRRLAMRCCSSIGGFGTDKRFRSLK